MSENGRLSVLIRLCIQIDNTLEVFGPVLFTYGAVSVNTVHPGADRRFVPEFSSATNCMLAEGKVLAVLSRYNPLVDASANPVLSLALDLVLGCDVNVHSSRNI